MRIKKVLVIKGAATYGALGYNCDEVIKGFCSAGCIVTVLDLSGIFEQEIDSGFTSGFDLIFTFNAIVPNIDVLNQRDKSTLLWIFLVDHPFAHHARLANIQGNVMVSCVDRKHVLYVDRFYPNISYTCFLPHGGIIGDAWIRPFEERKHDVVFLGGLKNIKEIAEKIAGIEHDFPEILRPVMKRIETDMYCELTDVIENQIREYGMEIDDERLAALNYYFHSLDLYRRYLKRRTIIEVLGNSGITIDVWGNGWEDVAAKNLPYVSFHESVEYVSTKHIMSDAKIVINDMPFFQDGSHERVFSAMQSGAICLTEKNPFVEEYIGNDSGTVFYDADRLEEVPVIIRKLMHDPAKMKKKAEKGCLMAQNDTWQTRAKQVLEIAYSLDD